MSRIDHFSHNGDHWWRWRGHQLGYYPRGRRPLFSERQGWTPPPKRIRIGRREITLSRLRSLEPVQTNSKENQP